MRRPPVTGTPAARVAQNVTVAPDGCWIWTSRLNNQGYGLVSLYGRQVLAHRLAYEVFVGPIPDGLELDHLCRVRQCVNPDHLEPVTGLENVRRSPIHHAAKTHCPQNHPYDEANTRHWRGRRICIACNAERGRLHRARQSVLNTP